MILRSELKKIQSRMEADGWYKRPVVPGDFAPSNDSWHDTLDVFQAQETRRLLCEKNRDHRGTAEWYSEVAALFDIHYGMNFELINPIRKAGYSLAIQYYEKALALHQKYQWKDEKALMQKKYIIKQLRKMRIKRGSLWGIGGRF